MYPIACRPPRFSMIFLFVVAMVVHSCVPSAARRADVIRAHIKENLYSSEHLAFGADPRSVSAVRSETTKEDIPTLIKLLEDTNDVVSRVAQYVIVSYDDVAIPYLEDAILDPQGSTPRTRDTLEMIRKRNAN